MQAVAAQMGVAAATPAPAELHGRVMAALDATSQLPAAPAPDPAAAAPDPAAPAPDPAARRGGPAPGSRSRRLTLAPRPQLVLAALATVGIVAAIFFGVELVRTERQLDDAQAQNRAIAAILTAPGARVISRPTSVGGSATVVISAAKRELAVSVTGLPQLPGAKVYELWLLGPPRTRPAGLLTLTPGGRSGPVLASAVQAGDSLGITVEPAGGTALPTTAPIVVIALAGH